MTKSLDIQVKSLVKKLRKKTNGIGQETMAALFIGGLKVESEAKMMIQQGSKTGKVYKRGNVTHQASAPGEAPATDTGALVNSIRTDKVADGVNVTAGSSQTDYAVALEFGTSKMEPRPYMQPALEVNRKDIQKKVSAAIKKEVNRGQ